MKPVIAHPAIDHRIHRHCNFERRVRVDERHQGQKAVIGNTEDADFAIRFRDILHQPVDGVVGVRGVIDGGRVLRSVQRPVDYVVALGAMLAAHILDHADVAASNDHVGGVVISLQDGAEMRALGVTRKSARIVRSTR